MNETLSINEKAITIDSKTIQDFLFSSETKLSEKQKNMFMQLSIRNQLDPFRREIYAIAYGSEFNIVTGYQVYIQRADATGKLDGWECIVLRNNKNELIGARITIHRKDFTYPFVWEVSLSEFDKGQSNWKKMPEFMIKKVCIGQGFRLAFPNELGDMPYLQEELEGLQPEKPPLTQPRKKSDKQLGKTPTGEKITLMVENIKTQTGTNQKTGKPWTKFIVKADDKEYGTFSETFAQIAKDSMQNVVPVEITFITNRFGNDISAIQIVEPPKEEEPELEPGSRDD